MLHLLRMMNYFPNRPGKTRATARHFAFTLVEMLVVLAIIALLASLLVPTIQHSQARAQAAQCVSKLRKMGVAHALYQNDNDGYLADNSRQRLPPGVNGQGWTQKLAPYMGVDPGTDLRPKTGETTFTCPLVPEGTFYGLWASYHVNGHLNTDVDRQQGQTLKLAAFSHPSSKVFLGDCANIQARFKHNEFAIVKGNIAARHQGKANMLFLDGHVAALGAPPLPEVGGSWATGARWLMPNHPPPEGL